MRGIILVISGEKKHMKRGFREKKNKYKVLS